MTGQNANETILEFMRTRRSVPAKTMQPWGEGVAPTAEQIRDMAAIAARVPDHGKIAPWRFVEISPAARKRLNERVLKRALEINPELEGEARQVEEGRFSRSAAIIMLVYAPTDHPKVPEWEQMLSAGAVGMNWLIAANAHGFDAQWLTEWIAFDDQLAVDFGLADGERIAGFIHIGAKTMPKTERARPDLADILSVME